METFTITFGDQAENHVGMQKIGNPSFYGFSFNDLINCKTNFENHGLQCHLIHLNSYLPNNIKTNDAYVLIIKNCVDFLIDNADNLLNELKSLNYDTKALMYGRVVNKSARYNLCLDHQAQSPNYVNGQGTIVAYSTVPYIDKIRNELSKYLNGANNLVGEINYYYDINKCGIGFHGDTERIKVIGVRVGKSLPLHYQWYQHKSRIGNRAIINLSHGDIYVMSEKAVGYDWKNSSIPTLRHATGSSQYTK